MKPVLRLGLNGVIQSFKDKERSHGQQAGVAGHKKGGIAPALSDRNSAEAYLISPTEILRYSTFIFTPPCT